MKELYIEGLAGHNDHKSCMSSRKAEREALIVVCAGWVLSPENSSDYRVPMRSQPAEGNISGNDKQ